MYHVVTGGKVCGKIVLQIDKDSGEVLNEFKTADEAAKHIGKLRGSDINQVCNGYLLKSGNPRQTAQGFKWAYK